MSEQIFTEKQLKWRFKHDRRPLADPPDPKVAFDDVKDAAARPYYPGRSVDSARRMEPLRSQSRAR
jgi:hypothetical protein